MTNQPSIDQYRGTKPIMCSRIFENVVRPARFQWIGRAALVLQCLFWRYCLSQFSARVFQGFSTLRDLGIYLDSERMDPEGDVSVNSLYSGDAKGIINDALFKYYNPKGALQRKRPARLCPWVRKNACATWC